MLLIISCWDGLLTAAEAFNEASRVLWLWHRGLPALPSPGPEPGWAGRLTWPVKGPVGPVGGHIHVLVWEALLGRGLPGSDWAVVVHIGGPATLRFGQEIVNRRLVDLISTSKFYLHDHFPFGNPENILEASSFTWGGHSWVPKSSGSWNDSLPTPAPERGRAAAVLFAFLGASLIWILVSLPREPP